MTRTWWRRNAAWLALLVPALLLALGLSAFRLTTLYLPWEWSRPTVAGDVTGSLGESTVTVLSVEPVPARQGAVLWEVELELSAPPDLVLPGCTVELVDADGARYGYTGAALLPPPCVPADAPGPEPDPATGELVPSPRERPERWQMTTSMELPEGHVPEQVRFGWATPSYLVLEIP